MGAFIPLAVLMMVLDPFMSSVKYFIFTPVSHATAHPDFQLTEIEAFLQYLPSATGSHAGCYPPPPS